MGAWIEILFTYDLPCFFFVAPHDGCVDWNSHTTSAVIDLTSSHPTMGAWIEISMSLNNILVNAGRTPRWVRGLKLLFLSSVAPFLRRTPRWVRGLK